jgi:hypothetical protein
MGTEPHDEIRTRLETAGRAAGQRKSMHARAGMPLLRWRCRARSALRIDATPPDRHTESRSRVDRPVAACPGRRELNERTSGSDGSGPVWMIAGPRAGGGAHRSESDPKSCIAAMTAAAIVPVPTRQRQPHSSHQARPRRGRSSGVGAWIWMWICRSNMGSGMADGYATIGSCPPRSDPRARR